jgi:lipopolysaccharide/colanic/teichoic acid biosynthesis glycosyltransferase
VAVFAAGHMKPHTSMALVSSTGRFLKRTIDIVGASVGLLLLFPLMAVLALLALLKDGRPVLHRRRVVGPRGEFDAFKFRTMHVDADQVLRDNPDLQREFEINFKLASDPRITRFGARLRKSSLDELPQLWNVLKGEMSLVGPRMITPAELAKYGETAWIFRQIKPGLTGYWQIHGRQEVSYSERVKMDLFYVEHWSLALDLEIVVKTPVAMLRGAGAY